MLSYTGNGPYCYANSLHMSLLGAGASPKEVPSPGFLECLTTVPFGNWYMALEDGPLVFFSGANIDPDLGLTRAIKTLGWTCQESRGGEEVEALVHLRDAVAQGPVLVGPVDIGYLSYNPNHSYMGGSDHFMVVLGIENDVVLLHDPQGFPCAVLPLSEFMQAWKAERVAYHHAPYTLRSMFQRVEQVSRAEMIERTLPTIRDNLVANPGGPVVYGGVQVFTMLARELRDHVSDALAGHLHHFALPLAARRNLDASAFLREAGLTEAATCMEQQALLYGRVQYEAAHRRWLQVADYMERLAELEQRLIEATMLPVS
jgi:hypothetical protein